MIDIGGGAGSYSFYAAACGAEKVICLEPELAGSKMGMREKFKRIAEKLDVSNVQLLPITFQDYHCPPDNFDVILMHGSINHIDEEACINLLRDLRAKTQYENYFRKIYQMAAAGAVLIIVDCSSKNLFSRLKLKNPIAPTIEWHKHQPPEIWIELLEKCGFHDPWVRWPSLNIFGKIGQLLLANRFAAYFLTGIFCLHIHK
jgi:cyclopropane fatty-acyl-phospholipid synthase-like methyltransferase